MSKGEQTRLQIVTHALQTARIDGLHGLTIGRLASDLGLSKSGLFAHFRSKEQLQLQVLHHAAEAFVAQVVRPAIEQPRGEPRLRAMFERWQVWALRSRGGCVFVAAASELDDKPGRLRETLVALQRRWVSTVQKAAAIAIAEGHFREDLDTSAFAYRFESLLLGRQFFGRLLQDESSAEAAREAFEDLLTWARPRPGHG